MDLPDLIASHARTLATTGLLAITAVLLLRRLGVFHRPRPACPYAGEPLRRTPTGTMSRGLERKLVYIERHPTGWAVCSPVPLVKPIWLPSNAVRVAWAKPKPKHGADAGCTVKLGRRRLRFDPTLAAAFRDE